MPATADRWDDVVAVLGGSGDKGCWCQAPRGVERGPRTDARRTRPAQLRAQLSAAPPAGMLAYVDGEPAGWLGFGPRPSLPRLERSRTIPKIDDVAVWSSLIDYARRSGAPGLEAYPIDPEGTRVNTAFGYVGLTTWFEQRGFRRVTATDAHSDRRTRWLMRLDF